MNDSTTQFPLSILEDAPRFKESDAFDFQCKPGLGCFNQCCADVNIALTPYDVLRLRTGLKISSTEFLDRYTILPFSAQQKFPVVLLRMQNDERRSCPFVRPEGCLVYSDRPWACRMYPVGLASPGEETDEPFFFLIEEDPCEGHSSNTRQTIREWIRNQGAEKYEFHGEDFKQISLHPFFLDGGQLEPSKMNMLVMVLYDLDKFRRFVFESTFLQKFSIDEVTVEEARREDRALLRLGYRWLRFCLFGEDTVEIRREVRKSVRQKTEVTSKSYSR
ncbi:MAG: YkgJ family cysteine cluster protein [Acidobacteriota bacterium]|nr:MAG: YkgJ family cysteine cluster protein [Acidobacteriota bacterium]